jgi:hypothetical protein
MKFKRLAIALVVVFSSALTVQSALARSISAGSIRAEGLFQTLAPGISPASLDFGNQLVGTTSSPQTVMITNNDDAADLIIETLSVTGDFALSNDPCSNCL